MSKTPQELIEYHTELAEECLWDIAVQGNAVLGSRVKTFIESITEVSALKALLKMKEYLEHQDNK